MQPVKFNVRKADDKTLQRNAISSNIDPCILKRIASTQRYADFSDQGFDDAIPIILRDYAKAISVNNGGIDQKLKSEFREIEIFMDDSLLDLCEAIKGVLLKGKSQIGISLNQALTFAFNNMKAQGLEPNLENLMLYAARLEAKNRQ